MKNKLDGANPRIIIFCLRVVQSHEIQQRFRLRVEPSHEIRRRFRLRVVQIHEFFVRQFYVFATSRRFSFDSSTFLQHDVPENKAKHRFREIFVRQFYVFATSRRFSSDSSTFLLHDVPENKRKTSISQNFRSTVQRFCNIKRIFGRQFCVFAT